jgi:hypothetical protein
MHWVSRPAECIAVGNRSMRSYEFKLGTVGMNIIIHKPNQRSKLTSDSLLKSLYMTVNVNSD